MKATNLAKIILINALLISHLGLFPQNYNHKIIDNNYIDSLSVVDSIFFKVLDKVIEYERKSKYFSEAVSYSILFYKNKVDQKNIIKIEGSDNEWLFIKSEDLIGFFKYYGHDFFLESKYRQFITNTEKAQNNIEIFSQTKSKRKINYNKQKGGAEDDRWAQYFFGYDDSTYYFYEKSNYTPK